MTVTPEEFEGIARSVVRRFSNLGLPRWVDRDDLRSEAALAIVEAADVGMSEGLAYTIGRRAVLDYLAPEGEPRHYRGRVTLESGRDNGHRRSSDSVTGQWLRLAQAVEALPAQQYRAVILRYWGGLAVLEVAREMGISFATAKNYLWLALGNLRRVLSA